MRTSVLVAAIVALSSAMHSFAGIRPRAPVSGIQWWKAAHEDSTGSVPRPGVSDSAVAPREDPWLPYSKAPVQLKKQHLMFVRQLLDGKLQLADRVPDLPAVYAAALEAATKESGPIANADEEMNFGCVQTPDVPSQRLMLCAYEAHGGMVLVEYGGLKPGAWMRLYETSGSFLAERALYSFYGPATSELHLQWNALVGRPEELFSRLRRYLSERPEPVALRQGQ